MKIRIISQFVEENINRYKKSGFILYDKDYCVWTVNGKKDSCNTSSYEQDLISENIRNFKLELVYDI